MNVRSLFVLGVVLGGLVGCSAKENEDDFDDEKTSATVAALDEGTSATEIDELASADPTKAAANLCAPRVKGCRTRTCDSANPNVVHVALDHCGGRFDRHDVSGALTITFSANADGSLHSETTSDNLTIDGRPFSRNVSADITLSGDTKTIRRHAVKTGTKHNGDSLVHTGDEIVVVNRASRCRTVNGTGTAIVDGDRKITSTITALETCETPDGEDYCPTGTIESVNASKHKTVVKSFDGSTTASISISKPKGDKAKSWTLHCVAR